MARYQNAYFEEITHKVSKSTSIVSGYLKINTRKLRTTEIHDNWQTGTRTVSSEIGNTLHIIGMVT